ncbi:putative SapB synthase [Streptomyces sp. enrichment culture]
MDSRYGTYCLADRHFYEMPGLGRRAGTSADTVLDAACRPVPDGWRMGRVGDWLELHPLHRPLPAQGWKIHVSATLQNAGTVVERVWDHCVPRRVPFKFVPELRLLHLRNAKYADRGSSGKAVTVYPENEAELHTLLTGLHALLAGEPGPYILSDLRWHEGPLYVRYGAFASRHCLDGRGVLVPALADPDGTLVPDRRDPAFTVPEWVRLPDFLKPHLAARGAASIADLPYRFERALHFSNGGGVYLGEDARTGEKVVLKEARPHAGLASDGSDAVARLQRERSVLERLVGSGVAPELRDWFTLDGHRFLVMDHLPGRTLNTFFASRHPLMQRNPEPGAVAGFTQWALAVHRAVTEAVRVVHDRGLVFNDLHMFNIMVAPDEKSVKLLDFEAAGCVTEQVRQTVAHPGFVAPADRRGFSVDAYALACLRLALFLPLTTLLQLDRRKAAHLAAVIAQQFPDVPQSFLDEAVAEIEVPSTGARRPVGTRPPDPAAPIAAGDWPRSRDDMARAILASATPERDDRLFPGDIAQFADGGGSAWPTARRGYCTRWPRRAYPATSRVSSGSSTTPPPCPSASPWACPRGSPVSRSCWTVSAT